MDQVKHVLFYIVGFFFYIAGPAMAIVVAMQTSKSEGLSGILAGGGGGGGKVGREKHLDSLCLYLAYGWLVMAAAMAWLRP